MSNVSLNKYFFSFFFFFFVLTRGFENINFFHQIRLFSKLLHVWCCKRRTLAIRCIPCWRHFKVITGKYSFFLGGGRLVVVVWSFWWWWWGGGGGGGCLGGCVGVCVGVWVWVFICFLFLFFYIHTWNHAITEKQTVMFIRSNFTEIALFFQLIRTYTNTSHSFIHSSIQSFIHSFVYSFICYVYCTYPYGQHITTTEFNL